ncbi:hypothetical protein [Brachybacterium hainanense]|uniref:Uncharacterized protein n=1 Tax=Brachybacterium hainanense TaxID=1541174 RepID=A0ABV6R8A4_9MICO
MIPPPRRTADGRYPDWRRTVLLTALAATVLGAAIGMLVRVIVLGAAAGIQEQRLTIVILGAAVTSLAHVLAIAVDSVRAVPHTLRLLDRAGRIAAWSATLAGALAVLVPLVPTSILGGASTLLSLGAIWWGRWLGRAPLARLADQELRERVTLLLRESEQIIGLEDSVTQLSARLGEWELQRERRRRPEPATGEWRVTRSLDRLGRPGRGMRRALDWLGGRGRAGTR